MELDKKILSELKNKCPVCNKERIYKTKSGLNRANKLNLSCRSCINSITRGGEGKLYVNDQKLCSHCKEYKLLNEFHQYNDNLLHSTCKKCSKIKSEIYHKNIYRFHKYNITQTDYNKLIKIQENKCAICLKITDNLYIDHCHSNKNVRGLLCQKCNSAIGLLDDNIETLINAIKYLKNGIR